MRPHSLRNTLLATLALATLIPLCAQEYATVRHLDGDAQVLGTRDSQAQPITLNTPLMDGDTVWTGSSGRLDIFLQDGTHLWLDYDTRLETTSFPNLDPTGQHPLQARLWKGSMLLDVQNDPAQNSSGGITTPSSYVTPLERGLYLIEVESVDRTMVTAIEGSCQVSSGGQTVTLGRMDATYSEYGYGPTPPRPAGESAAPSLLAFRDQNMPRPERGVDSRKYLPENLAAYASDFDSYGSWSYNATYGNIWRPLPAYAGPEWSPYYNGRWAYTPWGTTWIPYEPWGWAPCHYGRWTFIVGFGWGWVPGVVFSPAWVAWYWGDGWIGWTPYGYNGPCWGPRGWLSVSITNIYVNDIHHVVIGHHNQPPSRIAPILPPRYEGPPNIKHGGGLNGPQRGGGMVGGIHLTPRDVDAYRSGRADMASLRERAIAPRPDDSGRPSLTGLSVRPGIPGQISREPGASTPLTPKRGFPETGGNIPGRSGGSWENPGRYDSGVTPREGQQPGITPPRVQPKEGGARNLPGYQTPARDGSGNVTRPEPPQRYQPRPSDPPNYQPRPTQPPSYQPRPSQPPSYQPRPSEPPSYQPRPSQPPSYQPRPSEPPSYQPRPSQPSRAEPRQEPAPRYIPSRPEPQNQPSRNENSANRGPRKF